VTTAQKLTAPPPRPPHVSTQANFFPTVFDMAVQKNQADVAGDITAFQEAFRQTGDPDYMNRGLQAYMTQKMGRGSSTPYQSIYGEYTDEQGNIVPTFANFNKLTGQYTDPDTGEPIQNFRKSVAGGLGQYVGQAKMMLGYLGTVPPEAMPSVLALANQLHMQNAQAGATGTQNVQMQVRRRSIEGVRQQVEQIKALLPNALPKANEWGAYAPNLASAIQQRFSKRTEYAQMQAAVDNIVNVLARAVGEQRGTQTEADAMRAYSTIVQFKGSLSDPFGGDTVESAMARMQETLKYLDTVLSLLPATPDITAPVTPSATPTTTQQPTTQPKAGGVSLDTEYVRDPVTGAYTIKR
jgi:hypothetical protein